MFNKNIIISGKYSAYMELLKEKGFFNRILDIYINAPIIGLVYNKKSPADRLDEYKDKKTTIFTEQVYKEHSTLEFIYRLVLLLDDEKNLPLEERINRAFRDDSLSDVSEKHKENMNIFNSYVYGGVEILYKKIIEEGATDYDFMKNAYGFMKEQNMAISDKSADDYINEL